jgi:hypothetical protein
VTAMTVEMVCPGCGCPGHSGWCFCGCLDNRERPEMTDTDVVEHILGCCDPDCEMCGGL